MIRNIYFKYFLSSCLCSLFTFRGPHMRIYLQFYFDFLNTSFKWRFRKIIVRWFFISIRINIFKMCSFYQILVAFRKQVLKILCGVLHKNSNLFFTNLKLKNFTLFTTVVTRDSQTSLCLRCIARQRYDQVMNCKFHKFIKFINVSFAWKISTTIWTVTHQF